ncbi:MAG TPA: ABC transporter ATP-binding protein [Gaiellaceae bacterium]|jgi:spermidine/putrescine transport system ATP-binding protein|nr:ABC transporter ATP-binding protein [Gaiellaceae bacterium]
MLEQTRSAIGLVDVSKRFGGVSAVDDVSLEIGDGEFFSLLGPSGCGKTTTLRMIAGFERPDTGHIVLQGDDVTDVPANRRAVNMVFQQYALFPHMSVYDNVAFGLKVKRVPRSEHRERVQGMLRVVSLEGLDRRRARQLSGGQQQRVALARALVNRPAALLLDEPLGALDVKLRKQMQLELKRIQNELGTTFVYVTHDQEEALAMSDRIAVMNGGRVEQIGTPREIYERPQTAFVADFIGSLNALDLRIDELVGANAVMRLGEAERLVVPVGPGHRPGDNIRVAVRPERVQIAPAGNPLLNGGSRLEGTVAEVVFLGMYTQFHVDTQAGRLVSHRLADEPLRALETGSRVSLSWEPEQASLLGSD